MANAKGASSGGKQKKKKWSKGKVKDKAQHAVIFEKASYDKLMKEVPTYKLITPYVLVDRLKISGSLARKGLMELERLGMITRVVHHSSQLIYTRNTAAVVEAVVEQGK